MELTEEFLKILAGICDSAGHFLKCLMAIRNFNGKTLCEQTKINRATFEQYIVDRSNIGPETIIKLSNALNINPYILNTIMFDFRLRKSNTSENDFKEED